jgi:hypothetical protein
MPFHVTRAEVLLVIALAFLVTGLIKMIRHRRDFKLKSQDAWHLALHERMFADALTTMGAGVLILATLLLYVPGFGLMWLGWVGIALAGVIFIAHTMMEHLANLAERRAETQQQSPAAPPRPSTST